MSSDDRRARARRRAWGRGPAILRFEPLEGRQLLSATDPLAAIAAIASAQTASAATTSIATDTQAAAASTPLVGTTAATASSNSGLSLSAGGTSVPGTAVTTSELAASAGSTSTSSYDGSNLVESTFNTPHNLDWGDAFHVTGTVSNLGSTPTPVAYDVSVYASASAAGDASAVLLGTVTIPAGVAASSSASFDQVVNAPVVPLANLGGAPSYYIVPVLQPADGSSAPLAQPGLPQNSVVTVTPMVPPNLVRSRDSPSRPAALPGGTRFSVTASVTNDSLGAAPPTNARIVLTPAGKSPGGSSDYQIGQVPIGPVGGLQTVTATQKITLPSFAPTLLSSGSNYTVTMIQDADAAASPLLPATITTSSANSTTLTIAAPGDATYRPRSRSRWPPT